MKQSYCGLCETCLLDKPDFLEAIAKVKEYLEQFPIALWGQYFPGDEGFSFLNFAKVWTGFSAIPNAWAAREGEV